MLDAIAYAFARIVDARMKDMLYYVCLRAIWLLVDAFHVHVLSEAKHFVGRHVGVVAPAVVLAVLESKPTSRVALV